MKKIGVFLSLLVLSSCATTYKSAARSEYIGNGVYEIRSNGNGYTSGDTVRGYMFRKAFETCAAEDKGFVLVNSDDTTRQKIGSDGNGNLMSFTFHGGRLLIHCEGPVDNRLAEKFRAPASTENRALLDQFGL